jgi:hypothetical protein
MLKIEVKFVARPDEAQVRDVVDWVVVVWWEERGFVDFGREMKAISFTAWTKLAPPKRKLQWGSGPCSPWTVAALGLFTSSVKKHWPGTFQPAG